MAEEKKPFDISQVKEFAIDCPWAISVVTPEGGGGETVVMAVLHPRLGPVAWLLNRQSVENLFEWTGKHLAGKATKQ